MKLINKKFIGKNHIKYDIETFPHHNFIANNVVVHNCNSRYTYVSNSMYCGSRTGWKKDIPNSPWWMALRKRPEIETFCKSMPGCLLYGECYGKVQSFRYGINDVDFVAFDILTPHGFMEYVDFVKVTDSFHIPRVPELYRGPYSWAKVVELAEGPSTMPHADHIREGCVTKAVPERIDVHIGRVILKLVGDGYLSKKK